jgi:UDP-N-acetylmuramyl pentapeptide phosphotransferase/UDP-N-acetylglucosamine-1-phosphate transferase
MPTPQGAGVAVIAATIAVAVGAGNVLPAFQGDAGTLAAPFLAAVAMAALGAADDVKPLPVSPRLLLQAAIIAGVVFMLPDAWLILPPLPLWAERALAVLAGLWFVNLVNFMDGLDWMTAAEVVPLTASLVLIGAANALPSDAILIALTLGGATLGFACFNRPPARIFLGDVGSLPIGLLLAWLLLRLAAGGHLVAAIILPLYYLADATITLIRRGWRGEPMWQSHRTHFYQRATDRGFSVRDVAVWVLVVNVGLGALAVMTVVVPNSFSNAVALIGGAALVASLLGAFARGKKGSAPQ